MEAALTWPLSVCFLLVVTGAPNATHHRRPHAVVLPEDEDDPHQPDLDYYDEAKLNISAKGLYLGSPCEFTCNQKLQHVYCDPATSTCQCDPKHPVRLGPAKGCAKPKKLGEQCFYRETCQAFDPHASCAQVNHNAYCQCDPGYHITSHLRPTSRVFCTEDLVLLTADMPTLLGVASGIFVLAGLLCMVLHLYTRARFHPDHLADARLTPPCLYSLNDTGGMLSATRPSSQSSTRSATTGGTLDSSGSRRVSRARGVPVSASRAGAARTAAILLISRHVKAVRRDGGAHPPKCAAKGDLDNVCSARSYHLCTDLGVAGGAAPARVWISSTAGWFETSKYKFDTEQLVLDPELQLAEVGEGPGAEGEAADEHAARAAARQDELGEGRPEAGADAVTPLSQQLHRWAAAVSLRDQRTDHQTRREQVTRSRRSLHELVSLLTAGVPREQPALLGLSLLRGVPCHRLDVDSTTPNVLTEMAHSNGNLLTMEMSTIACVIRTIFECQLITIVCKQMIKNMF